MEGTCRIKKTPKGFRILKRAKLDRLAKELERWGMIKEKDEKLYLTDFFRKILIENLKEPRPVSEGVILSILEVAEPLSKTRLCDYSCVIKVMVEPGIDN